VGNSNPEVELTTSAPAERNKGPILDVLMRVLPDAATVLEIASGTGQHAAHFAAARSDWTWQPTDADANALASIASRTAALANVGAPLTLDVLASRWPDSLGCFDALYCANMLHIAEWATCAALMAGSSRHLVPGGALVLYGPYLVDGEPTAPGNVAFDADLRQRNPAWGLRRLGDVVAAANRAGLTLERRFDMPANNLTLVFRRTRG
jgi:cyclopropane fatty-acyl-phospholipid synthase-like methyltransferase